MQRIVNLVRQPRGALWLCRRYTTATELEEKLFHKGPLDPNAVELMAKYESDIVYSSYVQDNVRPLSFVHRKKLNAICESERKREYYENAMRRPFSLALKQTSHILDTDEPAEPVIRRRDSIPVVMDKLNKERDSSREVMVNESKLAIFRMMREEQDELEQKNVPKYPQKWMDAYETYDDRAEASEAAEDEDFAAECEFGTPDPKIPITKIPCYGCGAPLQCADAGLPGYLPSELIRNQPDNMLRTLACQRCHFLKNYNVALQLKVDPKEYVEMISAIRNTNALAIIMVDLIDFPNTLWPDLVEILGPRRPVFVVGNKVDLLPQDSSRHLKHIKSCLEQSLVDFGFTRNNIKHTCLISAETNYGVEDLITNLHRFGSMHGDAYLIGCTNVGKSTLFNALLRSDYCRVQARNLIRRATASVWPGTTLRLLKFPILRPTGVRMFERTQRLNNQLRQTLEERRLRKEQVHTGKTPQSTLMGHIGLTFSQDHDEEPDPFRSTKNQTEKFVDDKHKDYIDSRWLYDTPGVIHEAQNLNLLTTDELLDVVPKRVMWPRVFYMRPGYSLFVAGLGRVDNLGGSSRVRLSVYASERLPILVVHTDKADEVYRECLNTKLMSVPRGDAERMAKWPGLTRMDQMICISGYEAEYKSACDIVLSSTGWVSVNVPRTETANFYAWTPEGRGIFIRRPSLIPYGAMEYRGKRIDHTPTYVQRFPETLMF